MKPIPVAKPLLGEEEVHAAGEAIRSGWVTQGPRVREFEARFAEEVNAPHAVAVSSCTTGLHLALLEAGVKPGDVVVCPSHSFIATANAIRHCGAEPVFVDVDPATGNMTAALLQTLLLGDFEQIGTGFFYRDVARLEALTESLLGRLKPPVGRLAAVLLVHQVGIPADAWGVLDIAERFGVPLIEDAACALGSCIEAEPGFDMCVPIGDPIGRSAVFSLHPRKILTTGDGGVIVTKSAEAAERFRLLRQHGMSVSDLERHGSKTLIQERYLVTGFNYRMTDIQAAVGLEQLKRLWGIVRERRDQAWRYRDSLAGLPGLALPSDSPYGMSNQQSFIVRLVDKATRERVADALTAAGIGVRRGIMCAHREPPYAPAWPEGSLPGSEAASDTGLVLPLYPGMTREEIDRVVKGILDQTKE